MADKFPGIPFFTFRFAPQLVPQKSEYPQQKLAAVTPDKNNNFGKRFFIHLFTNFRCSHSLFSALKSEEHYKVCIGSIFLTFRRAKGDGARGIVTSSLRSQISCLRSSVSGLLSSVFRLRSSVSGLRSPVFGPLSSVFRLRSSISILWSSVFGLLSPFFGLPSSVFGLPSSVSGLQSSVPRLRSSVFDLRTKGLIGCEIYLPLFRR